MHFFRGLEVHNCLQWHLGIETLVSRFDTHNLAEFLPWLMCVPKYSSSQGYARCGSHRECNKTQLLKQNQQSPWMFQTRGGFFYMHNVCQT